jgi:hypothetical protein
MADLIVKTSKGNDGREFSFGLPLKVLRNVSAKW